VISHILPLGKYYWSYDFAHQPTQAECEKSSPSTVFNHYAFMNRDSWEDIFLSLFGSRMGKCWDIESNRQPLLTVPIHRIIDRIFNFGIDLQDH